MKQMSFNVVKYLSVLFILVFGFLLSRVLPSLEFNNDYWLPNNNQYQQDLNYLEDEFQPGFGAVVVLQFPHSFFNDENIHFLEILNRKLNPLIMFLILIHRSMLLSLLIKMIFYRYRPMMRH